MNREKFYAVILSLGMLYSGDYMLYVVCTGYCSAFLIDSKAQLQNCLHIKKLMGGSIFVDNGSKFA